ncbi:hypothetical protein RhiirA5_501481 [Rhizophagus irregularis]|uniref:Uncharacterized protein n=1 Tax=Rhizophagus irregularis TaxID=588596 RepID=A0A2N0PHM2_9GLOM|nr:hypothetical protein RhiirA5_501481 [Rhizophagus irregularis]GET59823.1 hypothetical protein GLOIN_2v1616704 [Rhizophagus irregularis DAOM 181602=DAOM 197198]
MASCRDYFSSHHCLPLLKNWCQDLSRELAIGLELMYPITCTTPINNQRMNIQIIVIKKSTKLISRYNRFLLLISPISTLFSFAWRTGHCVDINDLDKASP